MQNFIQSKQHLIRYLLKYGHFPCDIEDIDELKPIMLLLVVVYERGLSDKLTWDLREKNLYLSQDYLTDFLNNRNRNPYNPDQFDNYMMTLDLLRDRPFDISSEDIEKLRLLQGKPGIYYFRSGGIPYYVGVSVDLANRIIASLRERAPSIPADELNIFWIEAENDADAYFLEIYHIIRLKPILNTTSHSNGVFTFDFDLPKKYLNFTDCVTIKRPVKEAVFSIPF